MGPGRRVGREADLRETGGQPAALACGTPCGRRSRWGCGRARRPGTLVSGHADRATRQVDLDGSVAVGAEAVHVVGRHGGHGGRSGVAIGVAGTHGGDRNRGTGRREQCIVLVGGI